jgi:hypothetical protein
MDLEQLEFSYIAHMATLEKSLVICSNIKYVLTIQPETNKSILRYLHKKNEAKW